MLRILLEASGFDAVVAVSGTEALEKAVTFRPDVILIDLGLPDISGVAVSRQLRAQAEFEQTLLIAVTGHESVEHREAALAAGFDQFFSKPLAFDQVLRTIS